MTDMTDTETWNEIHDESLGGVVDVDGNHYINCKFGETRLRYSGGQLPRFENCEFGPVSWYFADAALRTIRLIQMQNMEGNNQAFIDDLFRPGNLIRE